MDTQADEGQGSRGVKSTGKSRRRRYHLDVGYWDQRKHVEDGEKDGRKCQKYYGSRRGKSKRFDVLQ